MHNSNDDSFVKSWDVSSFFTDNPGSDTNYALMVLNRPLDLDINHLINLWLNARVTVTVDGGTVRWEQVLSNLTDDLKSQVKPPDLITGDFDSISEDIMAKYKKEGSKVIHTPDQDYTDFTKALIELSTYCKTMNIQISHTLVLGQTSGRIDHILANFNTLYICHQGSILDRDINLYLMSDDSMSWLLNEGQHKINIPENLRLSKLNWCSLIPLGEECQKITTKGLKWNLENQSLKFGKLVSTSNTYEDGARVVTIKCSNPIVWSMSNKLQLQKYKVCYYFYQRFSCIVKF